jgi:hypothetical protein
MQNEIRVRALHCYAFLRKTALRAGSDARGLPDARHGHMTQYTSQSSSGFGCPQGAQQGSFVMGLSWDVLATNTAICS